MTCVAPIAPVTLRVSQGPLHVRRPHPWCMRRIWPAIRRALARPPTRLALIGGLALMLAVPASAQFSVVYDPTNYANALLRYAQLQQQYAELVVTYQQIRAQYLHLLQQARMVPVNMDVRYRGLPTPWLPFSGLDRYGTIGAWIATANNGHEAVTSVARATQPLGVYGAALDQLSSDEASRVKTRYGLLELADASVVHGLEALGFLRGHAGSMESAVRALEDDAFTSDTDFNTQVAVLNKINASSVTAARLAKDTNNLLVSLLEQQLVDATARREAGVQAVNAHIAFETEARDLLQRTTARTTDALTTFRIP